MSEKVPKARNSKPWTFRKVVQQVMSQQIYDYMDEHPPSHPSDKKGPRHVSRYPQAVTAIIERLDEDEVEKIHLLVEQWNTSSIPEDVQQK